MNVHVIYLKPEWRIIGEFDWICPHCKKEIPPQEVSQHKVLCDKK